MCTCTISWLQVHNANEQLFIFQVMSKCGVLVNETTCVYVTIGGIFIALLIIASLICVIKAVCKLFALDR